METSRRRFLAMASATTIAPWARARADREIVDDAGRRVVVPLRSARVFAAGPPASVLVFAVAPDALLGWTTPFGSAERPFVATKYVNLPTLGRLTGRGNTANIEVVLASRPDLILDYGSVTPTFAFSIGRFPVALADLASLAWSWLTDARHEVAPTVETVVFGVRGPRVLAALAIGAALAASGSAYQSLFRNTLVSPDILGVSAGSAVGAVLGILLSQPVVVIQALAFGGGLVAVALVYAVANAVRGHDPLLVLVLAGIVIGALGGAVIALVKYLADPYNQLPAITYWLLGSIASTTPGDLATALPAMLIGALPLVLLRWRVNVLALGDEEARSLGVNASRVRIAIVTGATLMTAAAVSISGTVGWIGLVIPHLARLLVGPDFSRLLPASLALGAAFLLTVDTLARTIARIEIPLGVLTAFVGTPLFLWQLVVTRRSWQ